MSPSLADLFATVKDKKQRTQQTQLTDPFDTVPFPAAENMTDVIPPDSVKPED